MKATVGMEVTALSSPLGKLEEHFYRGEVVAVDSKNIKVKFSEMEVKKYGEKLKTAISGRAVKEIKKYKICETAIFEPKGTINNIELYLDKECKYGIIGIR